MVTHPDAKNTGLPHQLGELDDPKKKMAKIDQAKTHIALTVTMIRRSADQKIEEENKNIEHQNAN